MEGLHQGSPAVPAAAGQYSIARHISAPPLAVKRFAITLLPQRDLPPIEHTGSMLRGILGHALKAAACQCTGDEHQPHCLYQQLFKPVPPEGLDQRFQNIPPPFAITPASSYPGGKLPLCFHFTCWGPALHHLPLLADCWKTAAQAGLDPGRIPAGCTIAATGSNWPSAPAGPTLGLRFTSPFMVKRQGKALQAEQIGALDIFLALYRRLSLLQSVYGMIPLDLPTDCKSLAASCQVHSSLSQARYQRYSNRQKQAMPLEGATGTLWLRGPLPRSVTQALAIGQWLHIGGKTALGMGSYQLIDPDSPQMNLTVETAS